MNCFYRWNKLCNYSGLLTDEKAMVLPSRADGFPWPARGHCRRATTTGGRQKKNRFPRFYYDNRLHWE